MCVCNEQCVIWKNACWLENWQVCRLDRFELGGEESRKGVGCGKECGLEARGEKGDALRY